MRDDAPTDLNAQLSAIRARHAGCQPELVAELVQAILGALQPNARSRETAVSLDARDLDRVIARANEELANPRGGGAPAFEFGFAAGQLDATLTHTATATDQILDVCEMLDQLAHDLGALRGRRTRQASAQLRDATRRIYEACGFQDITGQRITKVVHAINGIETGIARIVSALGPTETGSGRSRTRLDAGSRLLDGPQAATSAMAQVEIDRLMASLG